MEMIIYNLWYRYTRTLIGQSSHSRFLESNNFITVESLEKLVLLQI